MAVQKINGKGYTFMSSHSYKSAAEVEAGYIRKKCASVRIILGKNKEGNKIYKIFARFGFLPTKCIPGAKNSEQWWRLLSIKIGNEVYDVAFIRTKRKADIQRVVNRQRILYDRRKQPFGPQPWDFIDCPLVGDYLLSHWFTKHALGCENCNIKIKPEWVSEHEDDSYEEVFGH